MNQLTEIINSSPDAGIASANKRAQATINNLGISALYPFNHHFMRRPAGMLHYFDEDTGDPVLMVHGNPKWSFLNREFISALAPDNRVIVPDRLGFGLSDKPIDESTNENA